MIELNFGPGCFSGTDPDMIISIPTEDRLKENGSFECLDSEKAKPQRFYLKPVKTDRIFIAVRFPVEPSHGYWSDDDDIIIFWVEERNEWIGIDYSKWQEDTTRHDESYGGPFELNDYCKSKLIEAYVNNIPLPNLKNVQKMSPTELLVAILDQSDKQSITSIDLSHMQLKVPPGEVAKLSNLTKLNFENNQLTLLSTEIRNLTKLEEFYLGGNQFTMFPTEIEELKNLKILDFKNNNLTKIPSEIENLSVLTNLYLQNNKLAFLPAEIGQLTNLKILNLSYNELIIGV